MGKGQSKQSEREAARQRYIQEFPNLERSARRARKLLKGALRTAGISDSFVRVRAKEIASFVKKLRKYSDDCWENTTDKVGAQVIVKTLKDVEQLRAVLESGYPEMDWVGTKDASEFRKSPTELKYSGVHVQVRLAGCLTSDGEPIECEIQLRTQAEDVWASLEHKLIYKPLVEPTPLVRRKIARLSVLVEMFDEEVDAALMTVMNDPKYADAAILRAAEGLYLRFVSEPGEPDLSLEVLATISDSLSEDRDHYDSVLADFVDSNRSTIERIYVDYGLNSPFAGQFDYFLFTQPESLIILERVRSKPLALANAVRGSDIDEPVRRLADAFGRPLPE